MLLVLHQQQLFTQSHWMVKTTGGQLWTQLLMDFFGLP
jgi:hypothetical protein